MQVIRVPIYRDILASAKPWQPAIGGSQRYIPLGEIHGKLGVKRGAKVLFFAGYHGDWAHQLAQSTQVYYTDVSREMTKHARQRFGGKGIKSFRTADAVRWPAQRYDYVASFEPFPLGCLIGLIALRALAHAKGMRTVYRDYNVGFIPSMSGYGAKSRIKRVLIPTLRESGKGEKKGFLVWKLESTPRSRRLAKLDLAVISALQKPREISMVELANKLKQRGYTKQRELEQSLQRIHTLFTALDQARYLWTRVITQNRKIT